MTTGLLGSADLAANTLTTICTLPAGSQSFTVNVCNRNSTNVLIRIAPMCTTSASPTNAEYFVYDTNLEANGVMQLSGLTSGSAKFVVVRSDTANVSVNVYGV
jgi:hypothetical protein